mgnify:CR=1 FL=1
MPEQDKLEIRRLRKVIRQHDIFYYVKDKPTISDREYDLLMRKLLDLEANFPKYQSYYNVNGNSNKSTALPNRLMSPSF